METAWREYTEYTITIMETEDTIVETIIAETEDTGGDYYSGDYYSGDWRY